MPKSTPSAKLKSLMDQVAALTKQVAVLRADASRDITPHDREVDHENGEKAAAARDDAITEHDREVDAENGRKARKDESPEEEVDKDIDEAREKDEDADEDEDEAEDDDDEAEEAEDDEVTEAIDAAHRDITEHDREVDHENGEKARKDAITEHDREEDAENGRKSAGHHTVTKHDREVDHENGEKAAKARDDSALTRRIAELESLLGTLSAPQTAKDRNRLAEVQARWDSVAQSLGEDMLPPMIAEKPGSYRRRLAAKFQKFSPNAGKIRLDSLHGRAFAAIEDLIFKDAQEYAKHPPAASTAGRLIPIRRADATGRVITTYQGDPKAWLAPFMKPMVKGRFVAPPRSN